MLSIQQHQFDKKLSKSAPRAYSPHGDNTVAWEVRKLLGGKWVWWFWEGEGSKREILGDILTENWGKGRS